MRLLLEIWALVLASRRRVSMAVGLLGAVSWLAKSVTRGFSSPSGTSLSRIKAILLCRFRSKGGCESEVVRWRIWSLESSETKIHQGHGRQSWDLLCYRFAELAILTESTPSFSAPSTVLGVTTPRISNRSLPTSTARCPGV